MLVTITKTVIEDKEGDLGEKKVIDPFNAYVQQGYCAKLLG